MGSLLLLEDQMSKAVYSAQSNPLVYAIKCTIICTAEWGANSSPERQEPSQAKGAFAEAVGRGGGEASGDAVKIISRRKKKVREGKTHL